MLQVCDALCLYSPVAPPIAHLLTFPLNSRRAQINTVTVASSGKKVDIRKQGLESIDNKVIQLNLKGQSESMNKKGWKDSSGREGACQSQCFEVIGCKDLLPLDLMLHNHRARIWRVQVCQQIRTCC